MSRRAQTARISPFKKSWPAILAATTIIQLFLFQWARRWVKSGAPALSLFILLGEANGERILPFIHLWTLFATVNLVYAIASTSWLLYWGFTAICYPAIFITCLFQFQAASALTRKFLRVFIRQLHFIGDKVAFFEIPALEIDTEVDGLMVLRGITFSLSTLSFEVHGVEVGIKLSDDLELAIQTENVTVSLFRGIDVGDCYANLKGGPHEMTFVDMERNPNADSQEALMVDTLLPKGPQGDRPELIRMKSEMTHGKPPKDSSYVSALKAMRRYRLDKVLAEAQYNEVLEEIHETSTVQTARKSVDGAATSLSEDAVRAAICSKLHSKPSVPHPPMRSVKVTTLQRMPPPRVRGFLHRLPMLLRLLLNPISYFHPIKVASITATASGRWIETMLEQTLFKGYADYDSDLAAVKARICKWVSDANFAIVLGSMQANAHVPVDPSYDITCQISLDQILAFRALPLAVHLNQVVSLGGADASVSIPSALLPHHEHLIPERPQSEGRRNTVQSHPTPHPDWSPQTTREDEDEDEGKGKPEQEPESEKDQVPMKFAARVHLPAKFDQELLDFVALIVKASKLVELEEIARTTSSSSSSSSFPSEVGHKISEVAGTLNKKMKGGLKKAVIANDQWLAKLVGKLMRKMEMVNGDLGYTGDVPIELEPYRRTGWLEEEGEKLLK